MKRVQLILVGGFLGAGKTTLLTRAAQRLAADGRRVALLANDQADELVDSAVLGESGAAVDEVTGGCFCCRFTDMTAALDRLVCESAADVILCEPVGSCTDLSATVLQPLKQAHADRFQLAPFAVLVDTRQVQVLDRLRQGADRDDAVMYLYRTQLEEADLIVLNKTDLVTPEELAAIEAQVREQFPDRPVVRMAAAEGEGVAEWLELLERLPAGGRLADVDYETYAAGEAALGWMNASGTLSAQTPVDWRALAAALLTAIRERLATDGAQIAHVKLFFKSPAGHVAANLAGNDAPITLRPSPNPDTDAVTLLINARVRTAPAHLRAAVEAALDEVAGEGITAAITKVRSFSPARPEPTHRMGSVLP